MMTQARKPKTTRRKAAKKPRIAAVREAALACEGLAEAAERLGVADLSPLLDGSKRLAAAWERGRLLRRVAEVAGEMLVEPGAADKRLHLKRGEFAKLYEADREIRELWDTSRDRIQDAIQKTLVAQVKEGEPKAIAAVERLFNPSITGQKEIDFGRLIPADLGRATGIKPEQWARWVTKNGCPKRADGRYNLSEVVDWLRRWERDKVTNAETGIKQGGETALETRRRIENDQLLGRLIELPVHVAELARRAHGLAAVTAATRVHDWAQSMAGQTAEQIEETLATAFAKLRAEYMELSPELQIADEARAKIEEGLRMVVEG